MVYSEDIKQLFRANDIKNTKQRHMVYSLLNSEKQPITADRIYKIISDELEKPINLSTVYRILEVFTEKEIVLKSQINIDGKALYEINHRDHRHHLICIKCNKIMPIKGCPLKKYERQVEIQTGYKILEHKLEIKGICPKCHREQKL